MSTTLSSLPCYTLAKNTRKHSSSSLQYTTDNTSSFVNCDCPATQLCNCNCTLPSPALYCTTQPQTTQMRAPAPLHTGLASHLPIHDSPLNCQHTMPNSCNDGMMNPPWGRQRHAWIFPISRFLVGSERPITSARQLSRFFHSPYPSLAPPDCIIQPATATLQRC